MLTDPCQQIQQCSAITLGRLVHNDSNLAEILLNQQVLPILLSTIENGNVSSKQKFTIQTNVLCTHFTEIPEKIGIIRHPNNL